VLLLHGYGADGDDLIGLSSFFARALPKAVFVAPNGPERSGAGFGYQWFGLTSLEPSAVAAGVSHAAPVLDAFIDDALASRGLDESQLALVGFSQGTIMALDRAMRRGGAAAIVGFSGLVTRQPRVEHEGATKSPVLLIHGTADPIVPFTNMGEAEKLLGANGFAVETLTRPGLGHGIDPEGVQRAAAFLATHFGAEAHG
jgi:phospholipase/carboxylesterase